MYILDILGSSRSRTPVYVHAENRGRRAEEAREREREVERLGMVWEEGEKWREEVGVHAARIVRKKAPRLFLTNEEGGGGEGGFFTEYVILRSGFSQ